MCPRFQRTRLDGTRNLEIVKRLHRIHGTLATRSVAVLWHFLQETGGPEKCSTLNFFQKQWSLKLVSPVNSKFMFARWHLEWYCQLFYESAIKQSFNHSPKIELDWHFLETLFSWCAKKLGPNLMWGHLEPILDYLYKVEYDAAMENNHAVGC